MGDTPVKKMGMSVEVETDDFEAAAAFLEQFGGLIKKHAEGMTVRIQGSAINDEPAAEDSSFAPAASIDREADFVSIDTPSFSMSAEPGRFAFEEEG